MFGVLVLFTRRMLFICLIMSRFITIDSSVVSTSWLNSEVGIYFSFLYVVSADSFV